MEAATAAVEAPTKSTAMEAATAAHAASTAAAATSVTTATATATAAATTATSECRSWLNQADRCQCEQDYNRFSHYAFLPWTNSLSRPTTLSQQDYSSDRRALAVN
jgi:hypothetical protein